MPNYLMTCHSDQCQSPAGPNRWRSDVPWTECPCCHQETVTWEIVNKPKLTVDTLIAFSPLIVVLILSLMMWIVTR